MGELGGPGFQQDLGALGQLGKLGELGGPGFQQDLEILLNKSLSKIACSL